MPINNLYIAILAAGKGTRMKVDIPKVMVELNNKPMINYVLEAANNLNPKVIYIIIGYKKEIIMNEINNKNIQYIIQKEQKGTAHAIMQGKSQLKKLSGNLLILSGDVPLIKSNTLKKFINIHKKNKAIASIITTSMENPSGYGRIIRNNDNNIRQIIEDKDATIEQKKIKEINTGIYIIDISVLFRLLPLIDNNNQQEEYYLPDVIKLLLDNKQLVTTMQTDDPTEFVGINSKKDLKKINQLII